MEIHMKYVFPFGNPYENLELHIFFAVVNEKQLAVLERRAKTRED